MSSRSSRTLYVGNLPGDIREREVEDLIYKVAIQCVTPRANLRWRDSNSYVGDVNSQASSRLPIKGRRFKKTADLIHEKSMYEAVKEQKKAMKSELQIRRNAIKGKKRSKESAVFLRLKRDYKALKGTCRIFDQRVYLLKRIDWKIKSSNPGLGKNSLNRRQDSGVRASPLRSFGSSVKPPKFYPADDIKKPLVNKRKARPTKLSKYDLYSKSKVRVDVEKVKPYYESLIKKYFPEKLRW